METDIRIDAAQLTNAAKHLRTTLFEFNKAVTTFDNAAAAMMQQNDNFISRFETAVSRLEKIYESRTKTE
jgi:hypothetical protein